MARNVNAKPTNDEKHDEQDTTPKVTMTEQGENLSITADVPEGAETLSEATMAGSGGTLIRGGASGAPRGPATTVIHGAVLTKPLPDAGSVKPRRFRVTSSPGSVMYDGQRVPLPVGKVVMDSATDIGRLRDQGVTLQELP